ncbi:MAG: hypothetical protein LBL79_13575 [Prevotella sp.]|jgi:hypothetical protein|nr:hypothetical protein [Prevotella sp.]
MKYFLFLLILPVTLFAQDVEIKRERIFTASGLYGFMNGGTDQFLEYDVKELIVRDIVYKGEDYTVEIYEMASHEDAFGIYSIHTFKCERADTLNCIDCLSPYQLQAVSENKYISVVFPSGSQSARDKADEVVRKYASMKVDIAIPGLLDEKMPVSGRLKYLRGPLSVSKASFSFANMMDGINYTGIWFAPERLSKDYRALIYLPNGIDINAVKEKLSSTKILAVGDHYIYISATEEENKEEDSGSFGF